MQYRLVEEERVVREVVRGEQAAEYADCDLKRVHATHFGEVELLGDPLTGVPVLYNSVVNKHLSQWPKVGPS